MFGLFCKGLHCAGCGKGLPLSLVLVIIGTVAVSNRNFDDALGSVITTAIEVACYSAAFAAVATSAIIALFCRKGPTTVYVRWKGFTYSQIKFMETGNPRWLDMVNGQMPEIAPRHTIPYSTEVESYDVDHR